MKKYHQLLLFVIAVASLSLLLVYRHEYNRLHYVLEVFNFFGQTCNLTQLGRVETLALHNWGPEPLWQAADDLHVYSAFWTSKNEAKAIVLQRENGEGPRSCYLWVEDYRRPIVGKFRFSKIAHDAISGKTAYYYYCTIGQDHKSVPYAITFSRPHKKPPGEKRVMLKNIVAPVLSTNTTVCVAPTEFNKGAFLEFLSYHKLIGIADFIFYGGNIPYRLIKIVTNLSPSLGVHVTFFPWNYPSDYDEPLARTIIEHDCLLRTLPHSDNAIVLQINEYIVPRRYATFPKLIAGLDAKERLSLPVQVFCVTHRRRDRPVVVQNVLVANTKQNVVQHVHRRRTTGNSNVQVVAGDAAAIHKYVDCGNASYVRDSYKDKSILKYDTDLSRSTLMQLFVHDQI